MKYYEVLIAVGTLLPLVATTLLFIGNRGKDAAAAKAKDAQEIETGRKHRELLEATYSVHKLEKAVRDGEAIRARANTDAKENRDTVVPTVDEKELRSFIEQRSNVSPSEIQAQLDAHRTDLEKENRALETAIEINSNTRPQLAGLVDPIRHSIELSLKHYAGELEVKESAYAVFPSRVVFTALEIKQGRTDSIQRLLMRFEFPNDTRLRVWLQFGVVESPSSLVGSNPAGRQMAHIEIEVYHNGTVAGGLILYDPQTQQFEVRGKPYPEWEDINRRLSKNGPQLASEVAALVLSKYQIAVAVQDAKQAR